MPGAQPGLWNRAALAHSRDMRRGDVAAAEPDSDGSGCAATGAAPLAPVPVSAGAAERAAPPRTAAGSAQLCSSLFPSGARQPASRQTSICSVGGGADGAVGSLGVCSTGGRSDTLDPPPEGAAGPDMQQPAQSSASRIPQPEAPGHDGGDSVSLSFLPHTCMGDIGSPRRPAAEADEDAGGTLEEGLEAELVRLRSDMQAMAQRVVALCDARQARSRRKPPA